MSARDEDFVPIYERFPTVQALVNCVCTYYPAQAHDILHGPIHSVGRGAEAYAFVHQHSTTITKFTQSKAHAKVSNHLVKNEVRLKHIVDTHEVAYLPELSLYMISEELLLKPQGHNKGALGDYFHGDTEPGSWIDQQVEGIIQDLNTLGIREWREDCVSNHNIMVSTSSGKLKAFDFGFTSSDFLEDFSVWY